MGRDAQAHPAVRAAEAKTAGDAVTVKAEESKEIAAANRNRISLTLTNDSASVVYVYKGTKAATGKGIRLNAEGGAVVIDDYTGVVTAATAAEEASLCVSEV